MTNILAISVSPTHPSRTYGLVKYVTELLLQEDCHTDIIAVHDFLAKALTYSQYPYNQYPNLALDQFRAILNKADGVIIATPLFTAAYRRLKTFLDLLPQKAFDGKILLPIATEGATETKWAIDYALIPLLSELKARQILSSVYTVNRQIQFQADGSVQVDVETRRRLKYCLQRLVESANINISTDELCLKPLTTISY
jgi:FMN reductase